MAFLIVLTFSSQMPSCICQMPYLSKYPNLKGIDKLWSFICFPRVWPSSCSTRLGLLHTPSQGHVISLSSVSVLLSCPESNKFLFLHVFPHRSKALSSVVFWERLGGKQRLQIPKHDPWVHVYSAYIIVGHLRGSKILRWNLFSLRILKFHSFRRSLAFQFPSCSWEIQSSSFLAHSLPFLQLPSIFQIRVVILFCSCHPSQEPRDLGLIPLFIPGTNKWESRVARPPCLVNVQGHLYASKYLNPCNPLCKYFDTITVSNPRST